MKIISALAIVTLLSACAGASDETAAQSAAEGNTVTRTNNHIDYVEFAGGKDLAAVKKFYGEAFGWEFQDWGPDYVSFTSAGLEGGFNAVATPSAGSTLIILYADDLEASEKNIVAAGGEIVERHDFPGGRRFHFRDPAGNVLGVWTMVEAE